MKSFIVILSTIASANALSLVSPSTLSYPQFVFPDVSSTPKSEIDNTKTNAFVVVGGRNSELLPPPPPPPEKSHEPLPPPPPVPRHRETAVDRNEISIDHDDEHQQQERPAENYDILYNDVITCPLKGYVAEDKVLAGSAFRVLAVHDRIECMTLCFHDTRCRSVNVLPHEFGQFACELNERDVSQQHPDPNGLVQQLGSVYYDRIECDLPTLATTSTMSSKQQATTTTRWSDYPLKSKLIEKFNNIRDYEVDSAYRASKDLVFKLNRLAMLEKVIKIFGGATTANH